MWGAWVVEDGAHTYVYGVEDRGLDKFVHVARTTRDDLGGAWRFWDGRDWTEDPAASARVASGVSNQFSVVRRGARWTLVTQAGTFGREISVRSASGPAGPWGAPRTVYTTPQWGGRSYTYNATAHPELATGDELVIGYNVNSLDGSELAGDADLYRPRFVRVPAACVDGQ
jgi:hypothetical protein